MVEEDVQRDHDHDDNGDVGNVDDLHLPGLAVGVVVEDHLQLVGGARGVHQPCDELLHLKVCTYHHITSYLSHALAAADV